MNLPDNIAVGMLAAGCCHGYSNGCWLIWPVASQLARPAPLVMLMASLPGVQQLLGVCNFEGTLNGDQQGGCRLQLAATSTAQNATTM
jgi:hypothetical protein